MKKDKRAMTLNALYPAVLTIVLIGIVLGIGLYVMDEVRDNVATTQVGADNNGVVNGTTGAANTTTLSDSTNTNYKLTSITSITYGATTLPAANYSFTESGVITYTTETAASNLYVNVTSGYTYDVADSPELAITTATTGLAALASWIAIIIVVIAAAVVLGVVLSSFGREPGV